MKTLIAEDDFTSRVVLQGMVKDLGDAHVAVNGDEAVKAVRMALNENAPYDLICLDILMPGMDGQQAIREIRALEESRGILSSHGAKIMMTTGVTDIKSTFAAFMSLCDAYLVKPIHRGQFLDELRRLRLIS